MKVGFCLPHESEAKGGDTASGVDVMRFARRAEEVGFDSVWLADHFCYSGAGEIEALGVGHVTVWPHPSTDESLEVLGEVLQALR